MDIKSQIETIIKRRKIKGQEISERLERLKSLDQSITEHFEIISDSAYAISDENMRLSYTEMVRSIDRSRIDEEIFQMDERYNEAINRFSRDYISIATVGKERQGKSRFLQSVGNLDNDIIPAYDAGSCTGATSVIWNDKEMTEGTVRAEINFKKKDDLVQLVSEYIRTIDPLYFGKKELKFEDIGSIELNELKQKINDGDGNASNAYKYLKVIKDNFKAIRKLFGSAPIVLYDPQEIKTYVAQNNGKKITDPDCEFYYNYLAVSRADIYCNFYADVGKIRLVDTIGLGTTQYGAQKAMLDTVNRECDAAIVVTMPDSQIDEEDLSIYNSLRENFAGRDTRKWLFYLSNKKAGHNDNIVEGFREDIINQGWAVADCKVIDSSDLNQVRDDFVIPMLETLLKNMDAIDEAYLNEVTAQEEKLKEALRSFIESLPKKISYGGSVSSREVYEKGVACFQAMASDLKETVRFWNQERNKPNAILWNRIQQILNNLDQLIPSVEKINEINKNNGNMTPIEIWQSCLHNVRNNLTDQFIAIDDVLESATHEFKNSLVKSLYDELSQMTGGERKDDEDVDMVEWLKEVMDHYLSDNARYSQIRKAFDFLYKFQFNTRAQLIQTVRKNLYIINPICPEYAQVDYNFNALDEPGEAIYFFLTSRMSVIEDELRYHLKDLYRTPNEAFYAAAEEFYDRLVFSSDMSGEKMVNMSNVWGSFFSEFSDEIWKEQAQKVEEIRKLSESYEAMKKVLKSFLENEAA